MNVFEFLIGPTVIFLLFVVPLWLILYYKAQRREASILTGEEHDTLDRVVQLLERMETRISTLEKILDAEHPGLRVKE